VQQLLAGLPRVGGVRQQPVGEVIAICTSGREIDELDRGSVPREVVDWSR